MKREGQSDIQKMKSEIMAHQKCVTKRGCQKPRVLFEFHFYSEL